MQKSDNINELATALSKAQGEFRPALKDAQNPHFRSKYATLQSVWEACRVALAANGLSVVQTMHSQEGRLFLVTTLMHASGQWVSGVVPVFVDKQTSQSFGSAFTYARRYGFSAIVGVVADEDDDAEAAMGRRHDNAHQPPQAAAPVSEVTKADYDAAMKLAGEEPDEIAFVKDFLSRKFGKESFSQLSRKEYQLLMLTLQDRATKREQAALVREQRKA